MKSVESEVVPAEYIEKATGFINTMNAEIERITKLCLEAEKDLEHDGIPSDIVGKIRAAIGKANLLMTKKFKQFRGLCEDCMSPPEDSPPTKPDDLLGFWEMVQIQIEDVDAAFSRIDTLRQSRWTGPGTPEPLHKRMKSQLKLKEDDENKPKAGKPKVGPPKARSGFAQFLAQKRKMAAEQKKREEEEERGEAEQKKREEEEE